MRLPLEPLHRFVGRPKLSGGIVEMRNIAIHV